MGVTCACPYIIFQPQKCLWTRNNKNFVSRFLVNKIRRSCRDLLLVIKSSTCCAQGPTMNFSVYSHCQVLIQGVEGRDKQHLVLHCHVKRTKKKRFYITLVFFFGTYPEQMDTIRSTFRFLHNKKVIGSDLISTGTFIM